MRLDDIRPEDLRLAKTSNAHEALAKARASALSMTERRILILTDGRRSLADIVSILGKDIVPIVHDLIRRDYLAQVASPSMDTDTNTEDERIDLGDRLSHLLRNAARTRPIRKTQNEDLPGQSTAVTPPPRTDDIAIRSGRSTKHSPLPKEVAPRSIISAKTHAIDLLGLHRDDRLHARVEAIRKARGEAGVADAIFAAMRTLHDIGESKLLAEAITLLDPLMPEAYLPALHAIADDSDSSNS